MRRAKGKTAGQRPGVRDGGPGTLLASGDIDGSSLARGHGMGRAPSGLRRLVREEWFLVIGLATAAVFMKFGDTLFAAPDPLRMGVLFTLLFSVILGSSLSVVRLPDHRP